MPLHADRKTQAFCATKVYNKLMRDLRLEQEETGNVRISRSNLNRILAALPGAAAHS